MAGLLSYLWNVIRYPEHRDFLEMGYGIEAREARAREYWRPHLRCSREFLSRAVGDQRGSSVAIIGSGRLLDVDVPFLLSRFFEVNLVDADPEAVRLTNRRFRGLPVTAHLMDITGTMGLWTESISTAVRQGLSPDEIGERLRSLLPMDSPLDSSRFDAVISLNLLSQLSFHWRERVLSRVGKRYVLPRDNVGTPIGPIADGIEVSSRRLEAAHLSLLGKISVSKCVVVCDSECCYYESSKAHWRCEPSLQVGEISVPGFKRILEDSWFWHLAPQGVEEKEYGIIHVVKACALTRGE